MFTKATREAQINAYLSRVRSPRIMDRGDDDNNNNNNIFYLNTVGFKANIAYVAV